MQIEDGTGGGHKARIDTRNRIRTYGVAESEQLPENEEGGVYSVVFDVTTSGSSDSGDCFWYIKNTDDNNLHVASVKFSVDTACEIYLKLGDSGTPVGGADNTPATRNAGSGLFHPNIGQSY